MPHRSAEASLIERLASSRIAFPLLIAALALAGGLAFLILSAGDGDRETPSELSVEDVYRRAGETLKASGRVYYAEIEFEADSIVQLKGAMRQWVDGSRQLAREEGTFELRLPSGERRTVPGLTIYTQEGSYHMDEGRVSQRRPRLCYGADLATSVALSCPGFTEESTTTVVSGSYKGRKAIVLVKEGTSRGSDETFTFSERLYLDTKTYLPFALVSEGEVDFGERKPTYMRRTYKTGWVSPASLPSDFFDPAAIGYRPPDPEAGIHGARDLQVYWLGREFSAPGVEPLVLRSSFGAPDRGRPYRYSLTYARAANPFDPPFLTLQIFFRDMWDSVTIAASFAGNAVFIGDTVVFLTESTAPSSPDRILTPEGLDELKRGLRPYEPAP